MPKKFLIHVDFVGPAPPRPVVQLSVNFWYLGLLVLGANLVLGSMLVGNHWSKVAPKLENSLLIFFRVALASQPFEKMTGSVKIQDDKVHWWSQVPRSVTINFSLKAPLEKEI